MIAGADDYTLVMHEDGNGATLKGVLRMHSPAAYKKMFNRLRECLERAQRFTLDISELSFMNSSGVTNLSRLVIAARSLNKDFVCVVNEDIPWQRKTLSSLQRLYKGIELRPRAS